MAATATNPKPPSRSIPEHSPEQRAADVLFSRPVRSVASGEFVQGPDKAFHRVNGAALAIKASGPGEYLVDLVRRSCTCPSYVFSKRTPASCKHTEAVRRLILLVRAAGL